jgi:methyl-accepting chemotaxis protein
MHKEQAELKQKADAEKREAMIDLAAKFEASIQAMVGEVIGEAGQMQKAAQSMSRIAGETSRRSQMVEDAGRQASSNVETVASAAEELSASIAEISERVAQAAAVANKAATDGQRTNQTVQGLAAAANKIGEGSA